jgi:RND family efflux transporter MFP subunit
LIHPETQGVIERISVQEGDKVQEGQMLFTLDSDIISNSLEEVKGQLELAQLLYQKRKKLWDQNIGSEIEFLQAKNSYESLDARARSLQAQFELSQVRAPFSGYVDEVAAKEGEMAAPGMPVLRLIALDDVYLKGDVSERYLRQVQKGTPVEVYFESLDRRSNSQIDEVSRFIKAENRTFSVRMDLENKDGMLKPNLLAEVRIRDYAAEMAITLPSRVILQSPDGRDFVYLFEAMANGRGKVRRQFIETGVSYEGRTEVLSGLESGLQVIDKGARSVKEGQRVEQSV